MPKRVVTNDRLETPAKLNSWTVIKRSLAIFLPLAILLGAILSAFYFLEVKNERDSVKVKTVHTLDTQRTTILTSFKSIISDLMFLSEQNELQGMLENIEGNQRKALAKEWLSFSGKKGLYDQIRFLDERGMEVVRVDFNDGQPYIVPEEQLYFKEKRYYFENTFMLKQGKVYVSPFDLNIEHGEIEQPLKPVIRFGTPVFDSEGRKRGIVILNYLGTMLLRKLEGATVSVDAPGQVMLLNSEGFWLKGPRPEDEWGFMYKNGAKRTFGNAFPEAWQKIFAGESGQFYNSDGLFTFRTACPLSEIEKSIAHSDRAPDSEPTSAKVEDYYWKIVSHVSPEILNGRVREFLGKLLQIFAFLVVVLASGSWFLAGAIERRKQAEKKLKLYQEHLEDLVEQRTTKLKETNEQLLQEMIERTEAEKTVEVAERRYRELIEELDAIVWEADAQTFQFTFVSKRAEEILGYPVDQWLKEPNFWADHIHPDDRDKTVSSCRKETQKGGDHELEYRAIKADGSVVWLRDLVTVKSAQGKPVRLKGVMVDITALKQAEEEVLNISKFPSENPNPTLRINSEKSILYMNKATVTTLKEAGLSKKDVFKILPDNLEELMNNALKDGKPIYDLEVNVGDRIHSYTLIPVIENKYINLYAVDITARKHLEEQLLQAQKMEAIGRLAGGVAHDFNNLLTAIMGYSQLLIEDLGEQRPLQEKVEKINNAGKQAASLTRQLLAFSRKQVLQPKVLDLNTVVGDTEKILSRLIGEDINLTTILEPALEHVEADPGQIEQVIMNLAVNSRDAMAEGGKITIKTENVTVDREYCKVTPKARPGKFVRLSVEDTGTGMDKKITEHIFEPFFTTKKSGEGTGIGLSTAYGIVKQHNGWINVYSEPGEGTIFKVYLPTVSGKLEEKTEEAITPKELQGNGERILLVEDEEAVREFIKGALEGHGYLIFEAASAEEALNVFEKEKGNFDLVLSDMILADKSGLKLIEQFLSRKPELRVLLSSGYTDEKSQWSTIREKGYRFLQKPYTLVNLLRTVRESIEQTK